MDYGRFAARICTALVAATLAACAGGGGAATRTASFGTDCVFQSTITSFRAHGDSKLFIYTGRRREAWVAEVAAGCWDLENQVSLALVDGDGNGSICGFGRDAIAYRGLGGRTESCRILSVQRLDDAARKVMEQGPGGREAERRGRDEDQSQDESR